MEELKELEKTLNNISDSYYDFVNAVLNYTQKKKSRLDIVKQYIEDNPNASSSDILAFISSQDDFYEDVVCTHKMDMRRINEKSAFHIHTYRCKHAGDFADEEYIERAIELGYEQIVFTDHAPFPGDVFGHRMSITSLEEYISTLRSLADTYKKDIEILAGLEVEYIPSFHKYIYELYSNEALDILILGQHMSEIDTGRYSFSLSEQELKNEYVMLGEAMIQGTETGMFDVIAHPDRIFRRCREWTVDMRNMAERIIDAAKRKDTALELNLSSKEKDRQYWEQFWDVVKALNYNNIVIGLDAHSPQEIIDADEMSRIYREVKL